MNSSILIMTTAIMSSFVGLAGGYIIGLDENIQTLEYNTQILQLENEELENKVVETTPRELKISCETNSMGLLTDCNSKAQVKELEENKKLKLGNIYIFKKPSNTSTLIMHRLVGCVDENCTKLIFKGDNNKVIDDFVNRSEVLYYVEGIKYY